MISDFRAINKTQMLNTRCLTFGLKLCSISCTQISHNKKGFVALMTIIIVSASALVMAIGAISLSLGELDQGYSLGHGDSALFIATGCMDEALERLRKNVSYAGGNLTQSSGSCIISVTTSGGVSTTTVVASTTNNYYRKLESVVTISNGVITVDSWQEKDN